MNVEFRFLIQDGLYEQNLNRLIGICNQRFNESPALYFSLSCIFQSLADEYNGQGIPIDRYNLIMESLQAPILALIDVEQGQPEAFLGRLNEVLRAFRGISW